MYKFSTKELLFYNGNTAEAAEPPYACCIKLRSVVSNSMKGYIFIVLFLSATSISIAQTTIQLILKGGQGIEMFDAFDLSQKEKHQQPFKDTLTVHFNKNNIDCYNIRYHGNGKIYSEQLWLDTGKVIIHAHIRGDELLIDTVLNSPVYYKVAAFARTFLKFKADKDTAAANSYALSLFKQNKNTPFSLLVAYYYLNLNQNTKAALLQLKPLFNEQGDKFSWFLFYALVEERMSALLNGKQINFTAFTFLDQAGNSVKPSLKDAEMMIVDFWFTACAPCLREHKQIAAQLRRLKDKKVAVVGVSTDENHQTWSSYLKKSKYPWNNYREDRKKPLTKSLGIQAFPVYAIVNKGGEFTGFYQSFTEVLQALRIDEERITKYRQKQVKKDNRKRKINL